MMSYVVITCAFFAFTILIIGAGLAHHLNDPSEFDDDWEETWDTPLCEDECDTTGPYGECSKCGYYDYLAHHKADKG